MAARFRRLGNGSSQRNQGILRSVRDAVLTLRHACASPTPSCVEGRELWSRVSYHAICFFLVLLVLPGDSTKSFHCTDTKLEHWRVRVIAILKVRMHYGHLRVSPRSLTSPGFVAFFFQVLDKAEWEPQMSKLQMPADIRVLSIILISLKLEKEKLVTS